MTVKRFNGLFSIVFGILFLIAFTLPVNAMTQTGTSQSQSSSQTYTITVPAASPWTDTGINLSVGEQVTITATGTTNNGSIYSNAVNGPDGRGVVSADGYSSTAVVHNPQPVPFLAAGLPTWSLIGYIGTSAPPSTGPISPPVVFEVGSSDSFTAATSGELYLGFNDNTFSGNTGQYQAVIKVGAPVSSYSYTGVWNGQTVNLTLVPNQTVEGFSDAKIVGQITDFQTSEPSGAKPPYYELDGESINVWTAPAEFPGVYVVHNGDQGSQPTYGTWTFTVSRTTGPVLYGMSPTSGPAGTTVTFTGSGLGQQAGTVSFTSQTTNASTAAAVTSWSDDTVVCTIPEGLAPGDYSPSLTTASGQPVGPGSMSAWPLFDVTSGQVSTPSLPSAVIFKVNSDYYFSGGKIHGMDVAPFIEYGRTFLPIRYMGYAIGMTNNDITWDQSTGTATFSYAGHTVSFTLGSDSYSVDGVVHAMDVAPVMVDGRVCVPARYFGDAFGYQIGWSAAGQAVTMTRSMEPNEASSSASGSSSSGSEPAPGTGVAAYMFQNRPPGNPWTSKTPKEGLTPAVSASANSFTLTFYGNEADQQYNGGYLTSTYEPGFTLYGNPWIWGWRVVWSTSQNDLTDALYNVDSPLYVYSKSTTGPGSGQLNSDTWYTDQDAAYGPDPPGNNINGNDPIEQGVTITGAPGVPGSGIQPGTTYYFGVVRILANLAPHVLMSNPLNATGIPAWYIGYTIPQSAGGPSGPDWVAVPSPGSVCGWTIQFGPIVMGDATTAETSASGPTGGKWGHAI